MAVQKVNHNVWKPFDAQSIAKNTAGTTSEWWDTNGWTDKVVTVEVTPAAGSADINVDILASPKGYYELNNETTVDTEDYEVIQIVDNLTAATLTRYSSADIDELDEPIRSMAVVVDNDEASNACTVNVYVEGWS